MQIDRRTAVGLFAAATASSGMDLRPATAQQTIRLAAASSHAPVPPWVGPPRTVAARSNGMRAARGSESRLDRAETRGGEFRGPAGTPEATTRNVTDMGRVGALFEPSDLPLHDVMPAAPFVTDDVRTAVRGHERAHRHRTGHGRRVEAP
jgi:hypothetical protein